MQSVNDQVIQDWKFKHGTIFRFESEDGKVGYFKKPDRKIMDVVSAIAKSNPVKSNELLATNCILGGDAELVEKDEYFYGLSAKLNALIKVKQGELTEL